jgi:hypothetical protein
LDVHLDVRHERTVVLVLGELCGAACGELTEHRGGDYVGRGDFLRPIALPSLLALAMTLLYYIVDLKSTGWGTQWGSGLWGERMRGGGSLWG